jgi:aspartyl/asparaginyl-tRNA synthetase
MGYGDRNSFKEITYTDACAKYNVTELDHIHEEMLCKEYGPVVFLTNFPRAESYWNMKLHPDKQLAYKCDVLLDGMETIGSAQRSSDVEEMRESFHTVSNGEYAGTLYKYFGKGRVEKELEEFLALPFVNRFGGGIGITRLIRSMLIRGLLK